MRNQQNSTKNNIRESHYRQLCLRLLNSDSDSEMLLNTGTLYMSNSQKVAIFFIPVLIDYLQIHVYVIDVQS